MAETVLYFNQKMEEIQVKLHGNNNSKMFVFLIRKLTNSIWSAAVIIRESVL